MGRLANYFTSLRLGDEIDHCITQVIFNGGFSVDPRKGETIIEVPVARIGMYCAAYLPWGQRTVSCIRADKFEDIISRPFQGCYMVRIGTTMGFDECYHIHTEADIDFDKKRFWNNNFVPFLKGHHQYLYQTGVMFKPSTEYQSRREQLWNSQRTVEVWGIISHNGQCYSVLVYKIKNDKWGFAGLTENTHTKGRLVIPY